MEPLTKQQVFDKVTTHLLTQREKAVDGCLGNGTPRCLYRAPNGRKCAVGGLIPDSLYDPGMEEKDANLLLTEWPFALAKAGLNRADHWHLLNRLQCTHDNVDPHLWHRSLRDVALCFELDDSIVSQFPAIPKQTA